MSEPSRIYLQIPDDCDGYDDASPVTWCKDRINDGDIEYVRAPAPEPTPGEPIKVWIKPDELGDLTDEHNGSAIVELRHDDDDDVGGNRRASLILHPEPPHHG